MTTATATTDPAAVPCATCNRPAVEWCRTSTGAWTTPHAARLKLAAETVPEQPPTEPDPEQPPAGDTAVYDTAVYDQHVYALELEPA